jgi:hypothetical protein
MISGEGNTVSGNSEFGNPSWTSGMNEISISLFIQILGSDTGYAYNPISKWTSTTNATFVLYHFQEWTTNLNTNKLGWYGNVGGNWVGMTALYTTVPGNTYHVGLQFGSEVGAQMWINGEKYSGRSGVRGVLGTNAANIRVDAGINGRTGIHKVENVNIYNRDISDNEMVSNFIAYRSRYGL